MNKKLSKYEVRERLKLCFEAFSNLGYNAYWFKRPNKPKNYIFLHAQELAYYEEVGYLILETDIFNKGEIKRILKLAGLKGKGVRGDKTIRVYSGKDIS